MESEEDTEDEADVSMYEKKVGCDLFYSLHVDARSRTWLLALAWGARIGAQHYAKRDDTELRRI